MSKKILLAATITTALLISLVFATQAVDVAKANPLGYDIRLPSNADTNPPIVDIVTPTNNQIFFSSNFSVSLAVTKPETWFISGPNSMGGTDRLNYSCGKILWLSVSLDGIIIQNVSANDDNIYSFQTIPRNLAFTLNLTYISDGVHSIYVSAGGKSDWYDWSDYKYKSTYTIGNSSQMDFAVNSTAYIPPSTYPSPTAYSSNSPAPLVIDLANHNYMNNVAIDEPVYFSAVVSNGVPPYRYEWKYRPYYIGTAIGDMYPTGDWIEGPTTQNFTLTPNSTGSFLIEVKVWDSSGAQGLFMSLPPGIWINAKNPELASSPSASPTPNPSYSPSPSSSPTSSPILSPSHSPAPTQQPTIEPSSTPNNIQENFTSILIVVGVIAVMMAVAGALFFFKKRKG